jgi:hypothetical protein
MSWQSVVAGAVSATALGSVLVAFGAAIGLSVYSSSPSWRDASAALALLSGFFLLLQAVLAFGLGGYPALVVAGVAVVSTGGAVFTYPRPRAS